MSTVPYWSGREVRALREARRMSVREFAAHLGISDRMVSKWEAGGETIRPRPLNQAALDTSLSMASAHQNPHSVVASGMAEWCTGPTGVVRWGRSRDRTSFRCTTPPADMLILLAI